MREIKAKAYYFHDDGRVDDLAYQDTRPGVVFGWKEEGQPVKVVLFIGLRDNNGAEIYEGDILDFANGDRIVIKCEDWLEFYADYVGDPKCEDQTRDFYRIGKAVVIGNIHQHQHLLET